MANDAEWVEDVRRWYFTGTRSPDVAAVDATDTDAIGYEAAHPALQSRHWPDAPTGASLDLS